MHRGFFAKALEDHPHDPLGSKYAPSVLAAYNSACSFVGLVRSLYSQYPGLTERMWFLFTHVFSCAVRSQSLRAPYLLIVRQIVLGSIATKCPSMALAPSALSNLDSALTLFNDVSNVGNARAAKVLVSGPVPDNLTERLTCCIACPPQTQGQGPNCQAVCRACKQHGHCAPSRRDRHQGRRRGARRARR